MATEAPSAAAPVSARVRRLLADANAVFRRAQGRGAAEAETAAAEEEEALTLYDAVAREAPRLGVVYLNRARALLARGRVEAALEDCQSALYCRTSPAFVFSAKAFYRLGLVMERKGCMGEATYFYGRSVGCCWSAKAHAACLAVRACHTMCPVWPTHGVSRCARRKMLDKGMDGFTLGNTHAMPLMADSDLLVVRQSTPPQANTIEEEKRAEATASACASAAAPLERVFLCIGVGDVRNVLRTMQDFDNPESAHVRFHAHMNDLSVATLARDMLLLVLASDGNVDAFISVWCNALLKPTQHEAMRGALDRLIRRFSPQVASAQLAGATTLSNNADTNIEAANATNTAEDDLHWLHLPGDAAQVTHMMILWQHWYNMYLLHADAYPLRQVIFRDAYAVHQGATFTWLTYGLAYLAPEDLRKHNDRSERRKNTPGAAFSMPGAGQSQQRSPEAQRVVKQLGEEEREHFNNWLANPTLLDPVEMRFLDSQGPFQTFTAVHDFAENNYGPNQEHCVELLSNALRNSWQPLVETLQRFVAAQRVNLSVWKTEGISLMDFEMPSDVHLDMLDTSNVVDYAGFWNLLLPGLQRLRRSPECFVQIQSMVGFNSIKSFVQTQSLGRLQADDLLELVGVCVSPVPAYDERGYMRWSRVSWADLPGSSIVHDRDRTHRLLTVALDEVCQHPPMPVTGLDPFAPLRKGWVYKPQTVATWFRLLQHLCEERESNEAALGEGEEYPVCGILDSVLQDASMWGADAEAGGSVRLRFLNVLILTWHHRAMLLQHGFISRALLQQIKLALQETQELTAPMSAPASNDIGDGSGSGDVEDNCVLSLLRTYVVPMYDLDGVRGGLFEPALAVALVRDEDVLARIVRLPRNDQAIKEENYAEDLWPWLQTCPESQCQLLDQVDYDPTSTELTFLAPTSILQTFRYIVLMDVQKCEAVADPIPLPSADTERMVVAFQRHDPALGAHFEEKLALGAGTRHCAMPRTVLFVQGDPATDEALRSVFTPAEAVRPNADEEDVEEVGKNAETLKKLATAPARPLGILAAAFAASTAAEVLAAGGTPTRLPTPEEESAMASAPQAVGYDHILVYPSVSTSGTADDGAAS